MPRNRGEQGGRRARHPVVQLKEGVGSQQNKKREEDKGNHPRVADPSTQSRNIWLSDADGQQEQNREHQQERRHDIPQQRMVEQPQRQSQHGIDRGGRLRGQAKTGASVQLLPRQQGAVKGDADKRRQKIQHSGRGGKQAPPKLQGDDGGQNAETDQIRQRVKVQAVGLLLRRIVSSARQHAVESVADAAEQQAEK